MKNKLSILFFFILLSNVGFSQHLSDQEVYEAIVNQYDSLFDLTFYTKDLVLKNTTLYKAKMKDTFEVFDPESYGISFQTGEQISVFQDSVNRQEEILYKERLNFPEGLYLIQTIPESLLHKKITLNDYIELESYPDPKLLAELSKELANKTLLGKHKIRLSSEINKQKYKYAIKAYCVFSNVVWDSKNKYCLVESGISYTIESGRTGMGSIFILERKQDELVIIKIIPLWEE